MRKKAGVSLMPVARYFFYVGCALVALLFMANWYWPGAVPARDGQEVSNGTSSIEQAIHIRSDQRWPEKVVIDTSIPTIIPPPSPPAPILAQRAAPVASVVAANEATGSPLDARAEAKPAAKPAPPKRVRVARHRYARPAPSAWASAGPMFSPPRYATPRFSTWASAGPMAPSWSFRW